MDFFGGKLLTCRDVTTYTVCVGFGVGGLVGGFLRNAVLTDTFESAAFCWLVLVFRVFFVV